MAEQIIQQNGSTPEVNGGHGHMANGVGQRQSKTMTGLYENINALTPRRKLRVVTVGAGFSGLMFAHKLQHQYPEMQAIVDHTIYEVRHDIGGTWLANVYPGVQCDVPAHIYAFPFDPNPNWSHFYASGKEINDYIHDITRKWNLDRDVRLNHRITGVYWQEDRGQWRIVVKHNEEEFEDYADIFISGQGILNAWHWPDIEGLDTFKGQKCHSAAWDYKFDYSHKRIAVIGNGSSGIQILPQMAKLPGTQVTSFQRGPTYIYYRMPPSKLLGRENISGNPEYTEEDRRRFRENPDEHNKHRRLLVHRINKAFRMFVKDSPASIEGTELARKQMAEKLNQDPHLCEKLIPKWGLGCRRITPGEGYLESFLLPNVHLTLSPILRISENAVHTADGMTHEVDVVACATGFDVSFRPQFDMIGRNGADLREAWKDEAESYLSLGARDMPNYFMFMGPNSVIAHGSLVESLNWTGDYFIKWLKKIASEDIKSVCPKTSVVDELVKYGEDIHQHLVWSGGCKSWYKKNRVDGRVTACFAGSALLYKKLIEEIRPEDFDVEYRSGNRWRFLGNGFTDYELDEESDLAWYIDK